MMQAEFNGWYDVVSLAADNAVREARWKQVQLVAQSPSRVILEGLVHLAFRYKRQLPQAVQAEVRTKFAAESAPVGDEELALLSACALAVALQRGDTASALAATLVKTSSFDRKRDPRQPFDLVGMAENALVTIGTMSRTRPQLALAKAVAPKVDGNDAAQKAKIMDAENQSAAIVSLTTAMNNAFAALTKRQQQFEEVVHTYLRLQDEELDMFWWLYGERSLTLGKHFSDVPKEQAPLVFGKELADRTASLPGPIAATTVLKRAGLRDSDSIAVVRAVQSAPMEWMQALVPDARAQRVTPELTPIHEAMRRRLEVRGEESWIPAWSTLSELDEAVELPVPVLAELMYREHLLIRAD